MKTQKKKGGSRKYGRNKNRAKDNVLSAYVRGKIDFEKYAKQKKIKVPK